MGIVNIAVGVIQYGSFLAAITLLTGYLVTRIKTANYFKYDRHRDDINLTLKINYVLERDGIGAVYNEATKTIDIYANKETFEKDIVAKFSSLTRYDIDIIQNYIENCKLNNDKFLVMRIPTVFCNSSDFVYYKHQSPYSDLSNYCGGDGGSGGSNNCYSNFTQSVYGGNGAYYGTYYPNQQHILCKVNMGKSNKNPNEYDVITIDLSADYNYRNGYKNITYNGRDYRLYYDENGYPAEIKRMDVDKGEFLSEIQEVDLREKVKVEYKGYTVIPDKLIISDSPVTSEDGCYINLVIVDDYDKRCIVRYKNENGDYETYEFPYILFTDFIYRNILECSPYHESYIWDIIAAKKSSTYEFFKYFTCRK